MNVNVVTWCVGTNSDYYSVWKQSGPTQSSCISLFEQSAADRSRKSENVVNQIASGIICLQAASQDQMQEWLGDRYSIHSDTQDTAVAYDKSQYRLVDKRLGERLTVLALEDSRSKKVIVVASAHLWPNSDPNQGVALNDEHNGAKVLADVVEKAASENEAAFAIIGLNGGVSKNEYDPRLGALADRGFKTDGSCSLSTVESGKKVDYIFVKTYGKESIHVEEGIPFGVDHENTPSDHMPLSGQVTVLPQKGWLSWASCSVQ